MIELLQGIGFLADVSGICGALTGLTTGRKLNYVLSVLDAQGQIIEKLSNHLLYTPSLSQVNGLSTNYQRLTTEIMSLKSQFNMFQKAFRQDLLISRTYQTSESFYKIFKIVLVTYYLILSLLERCRILMKRQFQ